MKSMLYTNQSILKGKVGNNAFSYDTRENKTLIIPSLIEGTLKDVKIGDAIVFEEVEDGVLKSCKGLKQFVRFTSYDSRVTIFDNHNHALYFWLEALREGIIEPGFELIHIDEHSDLWENNNAFDLKEAIENESYAWEFTNYSCNVGNYIKPALESGLIGKMIRIENEFELDQYKEYIPPKNSVLNIDLDFFAPEMDFISERKKIMFIRHCIPRVKCITIATSPYFIEQKRALEALHSIFLD